MILHTNSQVSMDLLFWMLIFSNGIPYPKSVGDWVCAVGSVGILLLAGVSGLRAKAGE